jgi:hypothetical protein
MIPPTRRLEQHMEAELGRVTKTSGSHYVLVSIEDKKAIFKNHKRDIYLIIDFLNNSVYVDDYEYTFRRYGIAIDHFPNLRKFIKIVRDVILDMNYREKDIKEINALIEDLFLSIYGSTG